MPSQRPFFVSFLNSSIEGICLQIRRNVAGTNTRPKILFLTDRNILANQSFNKFDGFASYVLERRCPGSVRKGGSASTNGSIFLMIFQTFMAAEEFLQPLEEGCLPLTALCCAFDFRRPEAVAAGAVLDILVRHMAGSER